MIVRVSMLSVAALIIAGAVAAADEPRVTGQLKENTLAILIDGKEFTTFHFAPEQPKPYFSPVKTAEGAVITRPIDDPADKDHPHHRGIWCAVDEVNEIDFWAEKGKIVNKSLNWSHVGSALQLEINNDWMGPQEPVVHESSTVTIFPNRLMVYRTTFAKPEDLAKVTFDDTKEGLFGIRVASTMRGVAGGVITNADGLKGEKECWGKPSRWVDYSGPVDGKTRGVTLMDSPKNFRPARYHCRDYGLFTMSPFGEGAYQSDAAKAKPVVLDAARPQLELTFGLYVHDGDAAEGQVADAYRQFLEAVK